MLMKILKMRSDIFSVLGIELRGLDMLEMGLSLSYTLSLRGDLKYQCYSA